MKRSYVHKLCALKLTGLVLPCILFRRVLVWVMFESHSLLSSHRSKLHYSYHSLGKILKSSVNVIGHRNSVQKVLRKTRIDTTISSKTYSFYHTVCTQELIQNAAQSDLKKHHATIDLRSVLSNASTSCDASCGPTSCRYLQRTITDACCTSQRRTSALSVVISALPDASRHSWPGIYRATFNAHNKVR
jgi:hypothetical protein